MKNRFTFDDLDGLSDNETELPQKHDGDLTFGPSDRVIKNILNYSRSLMVLKTKLSGNFNFILN